MAEVMDTMALTMRDVQDEEGRWYAMQLRPFKTLEVLGGLCVTEIDLRYGVTRQTAHCWLRDPAPAGRTNLGRVRCKKRRLPVFQQAKG